MESISNHQARNVNEICGRRTANEDNCFSQSNSKNRRRYRWSYLHLSKTRFSAEGFEDLEPLWEKPFQDQDLVPISDGSLGVLMMN